MQHVFPIWAGAFPEADAAIALIGNWVRALMARDVLVERRPYRRQIPGAL